MAYEYGMGKPSMARPGTIDDFMQQRQMYQYGQEQQYQQNQAAAMQMRNQMAMQDYEADLALDQEVKRNRLGLNGLQGMLSDPYSRAYEAADAQGNPYDGSISMSVSPDAATAPEQIERKSVGLGLSRMIRPEFKDALTSMRTEDSTLANRVSPYDNDVRRRETLVKELDALNKIYESLDDSNVDKPSYASRMKVIVDELGAAPVIGASATEVPGGGVKPAATASKPSATEANGELKVSVAPASPKGAPGSYEEFREKYKSLYPSASEETIKARFAAGGR